MNPVQFKKAFQRRIGDVRPFERLLDLLPDVAFFMKDRKGRFVMHNRRSCEYCRVSSEAETLGKTDFDFFPEARAKMYVEGDRQVMESGKPILNAIAPAPEEAGSDRLIVYSKVPVKDRRGRIIGIAGIQVLPGGRVFVCNAGGQVPFFEVTRDGRVAWSCDPAKPPIPLGHGVQRLDVPGTPVR